MQQGRDFVWEMGEHLLDANLTQAHEPQDAEVAVEEARLIWKHAPSRVASEDYICKWRHPVPKVGDRIHVVQIFADVRSILPKLLLCHRSLDCPILQVNTQVNQTLSGTDERGSCAREPAR